MRQFTFAPFAKITSFYEENAVITGWEHPHSNLPLVRHLTLNPSPLISPQRWAERLNPVGILKSRRRQVIFQHF
jgi:hypothetical protein